LRGQPSESHRLCRRMITRAIRRCPAGMAAKLPAYYAGEVCRVRYALTTALEPVATPTFGAVGRVL